MYRHHVITKKRKNLAFRELGKRFVDGFHRCTNSPFSDSLHNCSKTATPKQILGLPLSQLLHQWRTGAAAYILQRKLQPSKCTR